MQTSHFLFIPNKSFLYRFEAVLTMFLLCSAFSHGLPFSPCVSLGYIVFSGPRRANGVQGLRFIIQSEKAPHYLESRVEAFLSTMEKSVEEMSDEAFQKHIQALAIRRLDKPKKLAAECAKYWGEIISQQYNFDRGKASQQFLILFHLSDTPF